MSFLADVNVLVDLALDRHPWSTDAARLFDEAATRRITVFVSAISLPTIFYITRRAVGVAPAFAAVDRILATTEIVEVGARTLIAARALPGNDFEDNIQIACAVSANVDQIVTRNHADFSHSSIRVLSPSELLAELASQP